MPGVDMSRFLAGLAGAVCLLAAFLHWQNYGLRLKRYNISDPRLPEAFKGFKILQVSDYHNTGLLHKKIVNNAVLQNPDIILITGDLFDCRRYDKQRGLSLAEDLVKIAPVFFVSGNHESRLKDYDEVILRLEKAGVNIADNKKFAIEKDGDYITLVGMPDPQFYLGADERGGRPLRDPQEKRTKRVRELFRRDLFRMCKADNSFKILASHRPEFIHTYSDGDISLAFTGHAHGGQFGVPFADTGVYVPNQGFFPKYASGVKYEKDTCEIISRGLGNSVFPQRLFNRPQLVCVVLN